MQGSIALFHLTLQVPEDMDEGFIPVQVDDALFDNGETIVISINGGISVGCSNPDCEGICNGSAYLDDCSQCVGGTTGMEPNWAMDCAEVCYGNAYVDDCGVCDDIQENDNETCSGCMDPLALNYDPDAIIDEGCIYGLPGDLNADGTVNVVDVVLMVSIILLYEDMTEYHVLVGDFVEDGTISILDLVVLVEIILNS